MTGAGRSSIRPARSDDAAFIARIVLAAQRGPQPRGWFDIALDRPQDECLAFMTRLAVARVRSWYHVAHFLIAEVDGQPVAALCAMPASGTVVAARAAIEEVAAETGADADSILARGAYARNCWVQGGEGDWLIEHVARQASQHGRGLVQALIGRALADGKAAGFARASISFLIGNDAAERCYIKAGFTFAEEKRDAAFEALTGAAGFRRFARGI